MPSILYIWTFFTSAHIHINPPGFRMGKSKWWRTELNFNGSAGAQQYFQRIQQTWWHLIWWHSVYTSIVASKQGHNKNRACNYMVCFRSSVKERVRLNRSIWKTPLYTHTHAHIRDNGDGKKVPYRIWNAWFLFLCECFVWHTRVVTYEIECLRRRM